MKKFILICCIGVLAAIGLGITYEATGVSPAYIPVWMQNPSTGHWGYTWPALGKTLIIQGGYIEALLPPPVLPRVYGVVLIWDAQDAGFRLPAGSRGHAIWVNGLRYTAPDDFVVIGDLLKPGTAGNWPPVAAAIVICDYDPSQ